MPPRSFHAERSRGFTLPEVLIAIGLIAALAALLFPAAGRLRGRSDAAKCQNNLRQIANAGFMFAADNSGRLPDRARWTYTTDPPQSILPYLGLSTPNQKVDSVLTCPAIQKSRFAANKAEWHRTYSINQYATGGDHGDDNWTTQVFNRGVPVRTSGMEQPSQQAFFMDGTALNDEALGAKGYRYSAFQAPDRLAAAKGDDSDSGWRTPFIHDDHINVIFLDGHGEVISRARAEAELVGPTNPSASQAASSPRTRPFWGTKK